MLQVVDFLGAFISSFTAMYIAHKITKIEIDFKKVKFWLIVLIYSIYLIFAYLFSNDILNIIRIFLNCVVLMIFIKILINNSWIKTIFISFSVIFIMLISEFLCMLIMVYYLKIPSDFLLTDLFANIIICSISLFFINIKKAKYKLEKLIDEIYIKKNMTIIVLLLLTFLTFSILTCTLYFNFPSAYTVLLNFILVIAFAFLALSSFHETNMNAKLNNEYEIVINELNDYEKMLKEKRKLLHNKENDLISIRGLIKGKNKEALEYIDAALNDNYTEDINVLNSVKYIPFGGLQGLIYKKVLKMQDNKLNVILNVNKNIRKVKISGDNGLHNKTICTIVGILLDNACEAAINSKQKIVNIQVYKEESEFVIKIENSYKGTGDMSRIDEQGYSTKGKDRGFGLDFVKEEVSKNKWIANERIINADIFTQIIKIKISNN